MPVPRLLVRLLRWTGALCVGVLVVVGGLELQGAGLVAVVVAALLVAGIATGFARDGAGRDHRSVANTAILVGGWTICLLLALAGLAALAGGLVSLLAGVIGGLGWLAVRVARARPRSAAARAVPPGGPPWAAAGAEVLLLPVPPPEDGSRSASEERTSPLGELTTSELGGEWLRTSALLAGRLSTGQRQALVRRRAETLDELERRDPAGFARWLAAGPAPGSDPAAFVRGRSVQGDSAAGSDAA